MCGSGVSDGTLRCPACGESLPQRPAPAVDQSWQVLNLVAIVGGSAMILAFLGMAILLVVAGVLYLSLVH